MTIKFKIFNNIDTVHGYCEECCEETIMVAIISDYYKCVGCGNELKQHINGQIRYMQLSDSDKKWIKDNIKNG